MNETKMEQWIGFWGCLILVYVSHTPLVSGLNLLLAVLFLCLYISNKK